MEQEIADLLNMTEQEYWDMEEAKELEKWIRRQNVNRT